MRKVIKQAVDLYIKWLNIHQAESGDDAYPDDYFTKGKYAEIRVLAEHTEKDGQKLVDGFFVVNVFGDGDDGGPQQLMIHTWMGEVEFISQTFDTQTQAVYGTSRKDFKTKVFFAYDEERPVK